MNLADLKWEPLKDHEEDWQTAKFPGGEILRRISSRGRDTAYQTHMVLVPSLEAVRDWHFTHLSDARSFDDEENGVHKRICHDLLTAQCLVSHFYNQDSNPER
jgi:hypothetical protein